MTFTYDYPHPAVAVDAVVFGIIADRLSVLLIRREGEPFQDAWALPGGLVRPDETVDAALVRELAEETGLRDPEPVMFGIFSAPDRDPRERVISVSYLACVRTEDVRPVAGSDAADVAWRPADDPPRLAFDHAAILDAAVHRLRELVDSTPIAARLLPTRFKVSDLQRATEIVLGRPLDKRNFRRKIDERDWLEETTGVERGRHRPAQLYRLKSHKTD